MGAAGTTGPKQPPGSSQVEPAPGVIAPPVHQERARDLAEECGLRMTLIQ